MLFGAASVALITGATLLTEFNVGWRNWESTPPMPAFLLVMGWLCVGVFPALVAWKLNRSSILPVAVVILMAIILPHLYRLSSYEYSRWLYPTPTLAAHALVALAAAFLTWWGVQQRSRALINYSIVCFAISVLWFYFSSVMGKLERSFSLMLLGILFLAGGWALEKTRRKLVRHIEEAA